MEIADKRKSNVSGGEFRAIRFPSGIAFLILCLCAAPRSFLGTDNRPSTPTAMESVLPWKRQDDEGLVLKQNEFPAWASNKEYLAYNSPSATFLGKTAQFHLHFLSLSSKELHKMQIDL